MPRALIALLAVVGCLGAPQAASAYSVLTREGTTIVVTGVAFFPGESDGVYVDIAKSGDDYVFGDPDGSNVINSTSDCVSTTGPYYRCSNVTAIRIDGGSANTVKFMGDFAGSTRVDVPLTVNGGPGPDDVEGGSGNDLIRTGAGKDELSGFAGDDLLQPGTEFDIVRGGDPSSPDPPGLDTVSYAERTEPVEVVVGDSTFHNGSPADAFDADPTVRDMLDGISAAIGGSGDDRLSVSGPFSAELQGGGGADRIFGGAEADSLFGGAGDDRIDGAEGANTIDGQDGGDFIYGGPDADTIAGSSGDDSVDPRGGEDSVSTGNGFDVVETRDDEFDSVNCGADGDIARADAIDQVEECDPPPPVIQKETVVQRETVVERQTSIGPSRVPADLAYTYLAGRRVTTLRELWVATELGANVAASCRTARGRRCRGSRDFARRAAGASVRLKGFERKRLPVGSRLTIRVTKPGTIGAVKTLTVRKRKAPSVKTLCLPPGAASPTAC